MNRKKITLLILSIATMVALACAGNTAKYTVTGTNAPNGARVYLVDQTGEIPINSAVVSDGIFEMKGETDKDAFLMLSVDDKLFPLFNDGKTVKVNVAEGTLTGSALNTKLWECNKRNQEAYAEYYSVIEEIESMSDNVSEEKAVEMMAKYRNAIKKYAGFYVRLIEENNNSLIPVAFLENLPSVVAAADNWNKAAGEKKLDQILAANPKVARHPYTVDLKRRMEVSDAQRRQDTEHRQSVVGEKFRDLVEADPDGRNHRLSEYVGQGRWVLVVFWASWCGPCKAEMPNVTAAYKKYHSKGFEIVGLSFDNDKEAWINAIKDWEMPWIHLSDLKYWQSVAARLYSVTGIPDNLLIDPEGTIVTRDLHGKALEATLAEIFK